MKALLNCTTSPYDLDRFPSREALLSLLDEFGLDGIELLACDEDPNAIVPKERVIGQHMLYFPYWLDFYRGDEQALIREFGSLDVCERVYGGSTKRALVDRLREDFQKAEYYGAEYVVFHVSDARIEEAMTGKFRHSSAEVIDGTCDLLAEVLSGARYRPLLLLENLWQPGLTFTDPAMTRRLLQGVPYENVGLMLDTGHLFHANETIASQEEGLAYIHRMLDRHGALAGCIRGIHLNQSITGAYAKSMREHPAVLKQTYDERAWQMFEYAFAIDKHCPFTCAGVSGLIERISPEYLTFEFITDGLEQHRALLTEQKRALEQ
ncbi:MAG: sugar phosphate isomerase/epimerase [Eubacteriales bacterium]|nr:sugar phosphate isomerase/epimerase [Eubacteriales bacterium]